MIADCGTKSLVGMIAGALAVAVPGPAAVGAQDLGRDVAVWRWDGRIDSGRWFRLSSVNGPVTVELSPDNLVHVRAEKIVRRGKVSDVRFQVVQGGGDVRVCALWQPDDICEEDGLRSGGRGRRDDDDGDNRPDVQVRFTVRVPRGVRLGAGTVNGSMTVRDVTSDVRASSVNGGVQVGNVGGEVKATTVNGNVDVTTRSGPVNASTVNGNIRARMATLGSSGDMKFNTVNGNVVVETPASTNADVSMNTMHGTLSSDFPVQISGKFGPRRAEGRIGNGGPDLTMRTLNGSIELRRAR